MKKSLIFGVLLFSVLILNCVSVSAITGSMGNAKMILYPEVNGWTTTTIEKSILVKNVNDVSVNITLSLDEEGEKFLELIDTDFVLSSGEEKKAQFLVKVKKEGTYEGKINVFFTPSEEKGAGVALSSQIIVIAKKDQGYQEDESDLKNENPDDESDSNDLITGKSILNSDSKSKEIIFFLISTIALIAILSYLLFLMSKKAKPSLEIPEEKISENQKIPKTKSKKAKNEN